MEDLLNGGAVPNPTQHPVDNNVAEASEKHPIPGMEPDETDEPQVEVENHAEALSPGDRNPAPNSPVPGRESVEGLDGTTLERVTNMLLRFPEERRREVLDRFEAVAQQLHQQSSVPETNRPSDTRENLPEPRSRKRPLL